MFSPSSLNGRLLCTADYNFVCRSNWTCMWANCKWDDFQALNSADDKNVKMLMIVFCYGRPLNSNVYIYDINPRTSNCEAVRCRQNRSSRLNCFKVASIFEKLMNDYIVLNTQLLLFTISQHPSAAASFLSYTVRRDCLNVHNITCVALLFWKITAPQKN